jgi:hypothetical protein
MYERDNSPADLSRMTFVRNRYFYGQLLDVHHFESEQNYFRQKIWMGNRLVSGYGVICGLDVQLCDDRKSVRVLPGIALDKAGREIVVPAPSACVPLRAAAPQYDHAHQPESCECERGRYGTVYVCFHECESDPAPVLAGDCDADRCVSSAIRERYKVVLKEGRCRAPDPHCALADIISGDRLSYDALATWVTRACLPLPDDVCIPLANVRLPEEGATANPSDIHINVRPIVYTNDLLYELILCAISNGQGPTRSGKY